MKRIVAWSISVWAALAWLGLAWSLVAGTPAAAADKPVVVVELYTSQGCSSCPPADAFLHTLAKRDDVVALSLHVDYWDYIGWKDVFADHKFTLRQHGYAKAGHRRSVYTPQMVIHGQDHVVGNHPRDVNDLITAYQRRKPSVALEVSRQDGQVVIRADSRAAVGPMLVQLVRYEPSASVDIRRGENAGRTLSYANVVRQWDVVGEWNGTEPLALKVRAKGDLPAAVIVQRRGFGPVVAAAKVE